MAKPIHTEHTLERVLTTWGIVVILWSIFRANVVPPLWFSETIAKPLLFLLPVYFFFKKSEQKQSFVHFLGFPEKDLNKELLFSAGILVFVFILGLILFLTSGVTRVISMSVINYSRVGQIFILALITSIVEECMGRGFLFSQMYKYSKNLVVALFFSALLFFILFLPGALTSHSNGQLIFMNLILNFLLSFMTGVLFYVRRNVLPAIAFHTAFLLWFDLLLSSSTGF